MTWLFSCWLPCQWLLPGVVLRQGAPLLCAATAAAVGGAWTASAVPAPAIGCGGCLPEDLMRWAQHCAWDAH